MDSNLNVNHFLILLYYLYVTLRIQFFEHFSMPYFGKEFKFEVNDIRIIKMGYGVLPSTIHKSAFVDTYVTTDFL